MERCLKCIFETLKARYKRVHIICYHLFIDKFVLFVYPQHTFGKTQMPWVSVGKGSEPEGRFYCVYSCLPFDFCQCITTQKINIKKSIFLKQERTIL